MFDECVFRRIIWCGLTDARDCQPGRWAGPSNGHKLRGQKTTTVPESRTSLTDVENCNRCLNKPSRIVRLPAAIWICFRMLLSFNLRTCAGTTSKLSMVSEVYGGVH